MTTIALPHPNYPQLSKRIDTPFVQELLSGSTMSVNGNDMSHAVYNLIVSHRDLKMWCNLGMKPNRHWKVSQVKAYFGLKGSKKTLLAQFEELKAEVLPNG